MLSELFRKKKYATITLKKEYVSGSTAPVKSDDKTPEEKIDENSIKCKKCNAIINKEAYRENSCVCPKCGYHGRIGALERLGMIVDNGTFIEYDRSLQGQNPLQYPGYEEKVRKASESSGVSEAVITGEGSINGQRAAIGIMDSRFIMGSMGSVVGEKLTRLIEKAELERMPLVIFCTSGGARMQEGIISLMQMAKVSAALKKLSDSGILYISVLTDPTTGGVTASFAMLGDIILAEPGAQVGFAGKRVIEQTIKQKLPDDFQTSEFLMEHGFVDYVVERHNLKEIISKLIKLHAKAV